MSGPSVVGRGERARYSMWAEAHFLEKFGVSGVAVQLFEQWIAFDLRESGVALFIGILEPFNDLSASSRKEYT